MRVALGTFACSGIEAHFGTDVAAGVEAALRHYTRRLGSRRAPVAVPLFSRNQASADCGPEFDLTVEPEVEVELQKEARRQRVSIERLLAHAVFVYLADLDATVADEPTGYAEEASDWRRYLDDESSSKKSTPPPSDDVGNRRESPTAARRGGSGGVCDCGEARKR